MSTKSLARQYDKLTPRERFPLIVAAAARGDDVERERLIASAPRATYSLPDYWGVAHCFDFLSDVHFTKLLELAADYLEDFACWFGGGKKAAEAAQDRSDFRYWGYVFKAYLDGWRLFCAELGLDPEHCWKPLPGFETVKRAEGLAEGRPDEGIPGAAFVEVGAARYLVRAALGDPEADVDDETAKQVPVPTAEAIAASLRLVWEEQLKRWE
jgi:hypothetical protein